MIIDKTEENIPKITRFWVAMQLVTGSGTFSDIDFSGVSLAGFDLSGCVFKNCNFTGATFFGAKLYNTDFSDSDFTGVVYLKDAKGIETATWDRIKTDSENMKIINGALAKYASKLRSNKVMEEC